MRVKWVLILLVMIEIISCCWAEEKTAMSEATDVKSIVEGNNKFALQLYAKLRTKKGNLFFSPYSISTALAMTYAGARGETETQMAQVLGFSMITSETIDTETAWDRMQVHSAFGTIINDLNTRSQKGKYQLNIANALWGQKGYEFLPQFLQIIKVNYGGGLNEVDFIRATETARQTINAWVEKETKGKIKDLIAKGVLDRMTRLVLTNAIYFKGNWARQFQKDKTKDAPFTLINEESINVPMMNQTGLFGYMETDSFQALELPYVDKELSMIILLPRQVDGLADLEERLTVKNLMDWLEQIRQRKVAVFIPKFKLTCRFELAEVLKSMGMTDAFEPGIADFSAMTGKKDLFISAVIHKAYVDVNEEGTEAAAATAVVMKTTAVAPEKIPVFRADHPFLFLIRDNCSGSILFMGRVMNPKA